MNPVKYQIFVSSTYEDLKAERDQIIKATLEMGHIPVGMEMFSAADEEQWKLIARQIDQSDYYAVILAHRYGSVVGGISFTEKEYDYAVERGVPVIGFIINSEASWPADRMEPDAKKKKLLEKLKQKVRKKPVDFWSSAEELHGKFAIAFIKLVATSPRPGWLRASEVAGPEVLTELSRLSRENAELRALVSRPEGELTLSFEGGKSEVDFRHSMREVPNPSLGIIGIPRSRLGAVSSVSRTTQNPPIVVQSPISLSLVISNKGAAPADDVVLELELPAGCKFQGDADIKNTLWQEQHVPTMPKSPRKYRYSTPRLLHGDTFLLRLTDLYLDSSENRYELRWKAIAANIIQAQEGTLFINYITPVPPIIHRLSAQE